MEPCCSHNIFHGMLQALPFLPLLLLGIMGKLKSIAQTVKSLWADRITQRQN